MDGLLILAIVSAATGWCVAFHQMRQRERYRMAWANQCDIREAYDARLAESTSATLHWRNLFAKEAAKLIVVSGELAKAKDALKCALETKSAVESALAESEEFAREAVTLSEARWKQIEELQQQRSGDTK